MVETAHSREQVLCKGARREAFLERLRRYGVKEHVRPYYVGHLEKWLALAPEPTRLDPGQAHAQRLARSGVPDWQCRQALQAVRVWLEVLAEEESEESAKAQAPLGWEDVARSMKEIMQGRGYSPRTIDTYLDWVRRLALEVPEVPKDSETASTAVNGFLRRLAIERKLSLASLQQGRNALAWLFRKGLGLELALEEKGNAHHGRRLPAVLSREQVRALLAACAKPWDLFFSLQYGCGLRLNEILDLRVQDLDQERGTLTVRHGKGDKDRVVPLPRRLEAKLLAHLEERRRLWEADLAAGFARVELPKALTRKLAGAETSWDWQHLFGNARPLRHPERKDLCRYHPLEATVRDAMREAAQQAGIGGRVHPHQLRHSYATHLMEAGTPMKSIQELMGHSRLETTLVYLHIRSDRTVPGSPLDGMA